MKYALLFGESDCGDEVSWQWVEHCFIVLLDDLVGGKGK
jgi:hypothetical protein